MGGDAKVSELERLVLADEDIERGEISVHRLPPVQNAEWPQDSGDLAPHESFGLCALLLEPDAEVSMHRVLEGDAIARALSIDLHESIVDAQRTRLTVQELGEVRLTEPTREALGDFDAGGERDRSQDGGSRQGSLWRH